MSKNPLLEEFTGFDNCVPLDQIQPGHFLPAAKLAIDEAKRNIETIKNNPDTPTFENTIEALEFSSEKLSPIMETFGNLLHANATDEIQSLAPELFGLHASFASDISLDSKLFERVKAVYDSKPKLGIEESRLLKNSYKSFTRNGALLSENKKEKIRTIDQRLSQLSPEFSEKVIKATSEFELIVENKRDVEGIPESAVESAKELATAKKAPDKWIFNLEMPSYIPFLTYSPSRELREKMWMAYASRCLGGKYDTTQIIQEIVSLKHERAEILGYETHAHYVLEERMAKTPEKVESFLNELIEVSRPAAERDLKKVTEVMKEETSSDDMKPWDFAYYQEKLKKKTFDFDSEELRPYFSLDKVVSGAFELAEKLYGLSFSEMSDIPTYHPDVKVYKVTQKNSGEYVSLFYTDFFPRATKKTGAWMTQFREQGTRGGKKLRPHVSIVCNFTKPTQSKPSLLSFMEVRTLFHEFGHALHGMLSDCKYPSLASPNVYWDFVELPSQFMENWIKEREVLDTFAHHYETGETIPEDLFKKLRASDQFLTGYSSLRQLNFGVLDMAWHGKKNVNISSVEDFEKEATKRTSLLPKTPGTANSPAFSHIFGGGYSAGYYSYKWAEVLEADAFEYFKENGLFNDKVAQDFKNHVLSRGGTEEPMDLYTRFRGREPDPKALLRRDGLI